MFGRLQSSYNDVEYELTEMTRAHRSLPILFVAGDGLSLMRLNHLLATHPDKYIDMADARMGGVGNSNTSPHTNLSDVGQPERFVLRAASVGAPIGSTFTMLRYPDPRSPVR